MFNSRLFFQTLGKEERVNNSSNYYRYYIFYFFRTIKYSPAIIYRMLMFSYLGNNN